MNARAKLGLMFMAAGLAAAIVIINLGDVPLFKKGYRFNVLFEDVSDLPNRAIVKVSGVEVGRVSGVELQDGLASVSVWVDSTYPIYKNTRAQILRMGLIGNTYLSFSQGSSDYPRIQDGDTIHGDSPIIYEELVQDVADRAADAVTSVIEILENLSLPENLGENLGESLAGLRRVLAGLDKAIGPEGEHIASLVDNLNNLIEGLGPDINKVAESIVTATEAIEEFEEIILMVKEGRGTAGMLITSEEVESQVRGAIENIFLASDGLNRAVDRFGGFKTSAGADMYYDAEDEKFRGSSFIRMRNPSDNKYLTVGLENIREEGEIVFPEGKSNTITLLAGKEFGKFNIFGGAIRSSAGAGAGWKFNRYFELETSVFDFSRPQPWMNLNARLSLTDFLKLGFAYENILDESRFRGGLEIEIK